jgi:tetratricopeptide (TPR) repeat protein
LASAILQRAQGNHDQGVKLVKQALAEGLDGSEAEYAQYLIAETSPAALKHLDKAVELDPFSHDAVGDQIWFQILTGRRDEAHPRIEAAKLIFPEDPRFDVQLAMLHAMNGDGDAAKRAIEQLGPQITPEVKSLLAEAMQSIARLIAGTENQSMPKAKILAELANNFKNWMQFQAEAAGANAGNSQPDQLAALLQGTSFPPTLQRVVRLVSDEILNRNPLGLLLGGNTRLLKSLEQACEIHPDGALYLYRADLTIKEGNSEQAERLAIDAAKHPSVIRSTAARAWAVAAWCAADQWQKAGNTGPALDRALDYTRKRLALGQIPVEEAVHMMWFAQLGNDFDLARSVFSAVGKRDADNADLFLMKGAIELAAGQFQASVNACDRALSLRPKDTQLHTLRDKAVEAMRAYTEKLHTTEAGVTRADSSPAAATDKPTPTKQ